MLGDPALEFLQVLWRVEHALERASKHMEDSLGVSGPQRFTLRVIGALPGIGAAELAAVMHLHPSTITGIVQRLESRGLLKRVRHAHDGRRVHLHLTAAGARLNRPAAAGTIERAVRSTLAKSSTAEYRAAVRFLERFSALAGSL
jgi:DNA-binding MarR family transcriptional regulator